MESPKDELFYVSHFGTTCGASAIGGRRLTEDEISSLNQTERNYIINALFTLGYYIESRGLMSDTIRDENKRVVLRETKPFRISFRYSNWDRNTDRLSWSNTETVSVLVQGRAAHAVVLGDYPNKKPVESIGQGISILLFEQCLN